MSKISELREELLNVYTGILKNNDLNYEFDNDKISYLFNSNEFKILREKYNIEKIAGKGTDFDRVKRLLNHFSVNLKHSSYYNNSVSQNSLDLLEYAYKTENGINCLNKSKIIVEILLSLNIYARQVYIFPYSPYDMDNHVVCEYYDTYFEKWIMVDPTTNGYFIDDKKIPLSLLEMRYKFSNDEFLTFITFKTRGENLEKIKNKNIDLNIYYCKNLFLFKISKIQNFGRCEEKFVICNKNYDIIKNQINNLKYKIKNIPEEYSDLIVSLEESIAVLENAKNNLDISSTRLLSEKPLK